MRSSFFRYLTGMLGILLLSSCGDNSEHLASTFMVVNVLDKELYDDCHIKDSVHVSYDKVEEFAKKLDKGTELVIYCSNYQCSTSGYVAKKLKELGFMKVSVYEGGMAEWFQEGLPVEGPHKSSYLYKPSRTIAHDESDEIPVITIQELSEKMGFDFEKRNVAA